MDFFIALGVVLGTVMIIPVGGGLRKIYCIRRQRKLLEKYIGVRSNMGELVSLLCTLDENETPAATERRRQLEARTGELTHTLVFPQGRKDPEVIRQLRHMGFPLEYSPKHAYKYVLSTTVVMVDMNVPVPTTEAYRI
jgi:hypothetical protein